MFNDIEGDLIEPLKYRRSRLVAEPGDFNYVQHADVYSFIKNSNVQEC